VSISKAQIQAIREGFIQSIGETGFGKVKAGELPILEETLALYGKAFNDTIVKILDQDNITSSGRLAEPALPIITKFGTGYVLSLGYEPGSEASKYYDFVNKGVKGTKNIKADSKTPYAFKTNKKAVPVSSIEKWLSYNKLKSVSVKKYTKLGTETKAIDTKKSLAYVIARSIHTKGLKSTHYFDRAVTQVFNKEFIQNLAVAIGGDVQIQIKQTINESKNGNNNNK
jgi:hypothetical protein